MLFFVTFLRKLEPSCKIGRLLPTILGSPDVKRPPLGASLLPRFVGNPDGHGVVSYQQTLTLMSVSSAPP